MKTHDANSGQDAAATIKTLLTDCQIAVLPACKRAGMATSTLFRWERGQNPQSGSVDKLRLAILELACTAGTLPDNEIATLDALRKSVKLPAVARSNKEISRDLRRIALELDRADTQP